MNSLRIYPIYFLKKKKTKLLDLALILSSRQNTLEALYQIDSVFHEK